MRYFDLHCDTITECLDRGIGLDNTELHISVVGAARIKTWVQAFAVFTPDTLRGGQAWLRFTAAAALLKQEAARHEITLCGNAAQLSDGIKSGRAALLTLESAAVFSGELDRVQQAYDLGVRMATITWNGTNEAGGGCLDGGGLTDFGHALIHKMQQIGMVIDVSHLSDTGFAQVAEETTAPFVASHSNSRAVCDNPRNLTDAQFCEIVRRGGLAGLNLYPPFLGKNSLTAVLRHAEQFLSLGGENTIAMGTDFDGAAMPRGIRGITDIPKLYCIFEKAFGKTIASKIFFENACNFFKSFLTGDKKRDTI